MVGKVVRVAPIDNSYPRGPEVCFAYCRNSKETRMIEWSEQGGDPSTEVSGKGMKARSRRACQPL